MPRFEFHTTGKEVVETYPAQVEGKTFLITGPSQGGIGAQTAISLAYGKPKALLLLGRTEFKISPVIKEIQTISPTTHTLFIPLDLTDFDSIRTAVAVIKKNVTEFDVLINNAAVMALGTFLKSKEGIEMQFASNHIGHFLFTNLLLPLLSPTGKIVNVSSIGYTFGPVRFDDYNFSDGATYHPWEAYAQSKTSNILFAKGLAKRGVKAYSLHPGSVGTNLTQYMPKEGWPGQAEYFKEQGAKTGFKLPEVKTLEQGCATSVVAAIDPELDGLSGVYLSDCQVEELLEYARNEENVEKLWELSEKLVGEKFTW